MQPSFVNHRQHIDTIIAATVQATLPHVAVQRHIEWRNETLWLGGQQQDLSKGRLFLLGIGKAALHMGHAALAQLGDHVTAGIIIVKETISDRDVDAHPLPPSVQLLRAAHPVSNADGVAATQAIRDLLAETTADDVIVCLISGGASALLTDPIVPLPDYQALVQALLASGCDIVALNTVRQQLDRVKGGGLARWAAPAGCVSLILSDVVGSPLASIGSGPTVPVPQSPQAALAVLREFNVEEAVAADVWQRCVAALTATLDEERDAPAPHNVIIGDVALAATAAAEAATTLGFEPTIVTTTQEGAAHALGVRVAEAAVEEPAGRCLIFAGETTVVVQGDGKGGRNQEVALAAVAPLALPSASRRVLFSFATDGEDHTSGVAGAIATDQTARIAAAIGCSPAAYLDNNDSYHFFAQIEQQAAVDGGGLLTMAPTGTNVNDLCVMLTYPRAS